MRFILFAFCSLHFTTATSAQDSNFDPLGEHLDRPKMIRVMVEFIELPLPELTKLLAEPRKSANDTDLRKATGKLIESGVAKHAETQLVIARSGEAATSEGILEYIYPTEYEPSQIPNKVKTGESTADSIEFAQAIATGPTPTAFEVRNTGSTLEIQPTIGVDAHIIDLRLSPELVEHVRNEIWAEWNGPHGASHIKMPSFFSNRINTGLTLVNRQYCLAGTNSACGENGAPDHQRKILLFVRADIIAAGL